MTDKKESPKSKIGTVQGTALIISILTLIILLQIFPNLNRNVKDTSDMIVRLENRLDNASLKMEQLNRRICSTKYDTEISSLNSMSGVLEEIIQKSSGDTAIQAKKVQDNMKSLILRLKEESFGSDNKTQE